MKKYLFIAIVIVLLGVIIWFNYDFNLNLNNQETELSYQAVLEPEEEKSYIEGVSLANNQFAFDFYQEIKDKPDNIFFSPYSLSIALAMTYEGSKEETASQMENVLYLLQDDKIRRESYQDLHAWLIRDDKEYELNIANALWAQKDYAFLPEYFDVISTYYKGLIENLNFIEDSEGSRIIINQWVEEKTKDRIKDLIPQGMIDPLTRLVLTNAIYFKGEWVQEFNEEDTKENDFYLDEEETVKVDFMQKTDEEARFMYYETDEFQMLEMPYSGKEISMLILLPKEHNLEEIELTRANFNKWKKGLKEQRVNVYIPKIKLETKYFLKQNLSNMGMPIAFNEEANFSGMTGGKDLIIGEVIHQTFLEVDERGTEAAAATAVVMKITSAGPNMVSEIPVFRANRPFILLIQEQETNAILFMGRIVNPKQ